MAQDRGAGWNEASASRVETTGPDQGWGTIKPSLPPGETETVPGPTEEPPGFPWPPPPISVQARGRLSLRLGHRVSPGFRRAGLLSRHRTSPRGSGSHIQNPRSLLCVQQTVVEDQKGLWLGSRGPQDELQESWQGLGSRRLHSSPLCLGTTVVGPDDSHLSHLCGARSSPGACLPNGSRRACALSS